MMRKIAFVEFKFPFMDFLSASVLWQINRICFDLGFTVYHCTVPLFIDLKKTVYLQMVIKDTNKVDE